MIRGSVLLAACVGVWACTNDPTSDEAGKPYAIEASPEVVFVKQDSLELVTFRLIDELGGTLAETWTITNSSTLFSIALDSSYRPVYGGSGDSILTLPEAQTEVRARLTGVQLGIASFTVAAGGKTRTITVNVIPGVLNAVFTPSNPAPGQAVTMTLPAQLRFTPTSVITFPGNLNPVSLVIAPDSLSATFIPAPTTNTTASVTKIFNTEFPTVSPSDYVTADSVTGTASGAWTGDLPGIITPASSAASPNGTGSLTVTLDPAFAFKTSVPASVFDFADQTAPINIVVSPDSTTATMDIAPNVSTQLSVTRITFKGAPQFEYLLYSAERIYTPEISNFPATLSAYAPQIGQPITMTAGAGFTFDAALGSVSWPLLPNAVVTGRTATTITFYPYPGSTGNASGVSGVISSSSPQFQLTLPTAFASAFGMLTTVAAPLAGTGSYATAPAIAAQGAIQGATWTGAGDCGLPCQIYSFTVAGADTTTFTLTWSNNADLGLYFLDSGLNYILGSDCDGHGAGAAAQPETCTVTFPAAGTYYLEVDDYSSFYPPPNNVSPTWFALRIE